MRRDDWDYLTLAIPRNSELYEVITEESERTGLSPAQATRNILYKYIELRGLNDVLNRILNIKSIEQLEASRQVEVNVSNAKEALSDGFWPE